MVDFPVLVATCRNLSSSIQRIEDVGQDGDIEKDVRIEGKSTPVYHSIVFDVEEETFDAISRATFNSLREIFYE